MPKFKWYVVQVEYGVFGYGDTPEEAHAMAQQFVDRDQPLPPLEDMPRFTGTTTTGDRVARKNMTQFGEMAVGQLVLLDAEEFDAMGYVDVE